MKGRIGTLVVIASLSSLLSVAISSTLLAPEPALAKAADSSDEVVVVTSRMKGGTRDLFWIVDTPTERLLVYEMKEERLILGAVRDIQWDLRLPNELSRVGPQSPSVSQLRKETGKAAPLVVTRARKILAVPGRSRADERDLLYLLDTKSLRQVIYEYNNGELRIVAARNIRFDLRFAEWPKGKHDPSVAEVRERVLGKGKEVLEPEGM